MTGADTHKIIATEVVKSHGGKKAVKFHGGKYAVV
jgi:hypothetical protein